MNRKINTYIRLAMILSGILILGSTANAAWGEPDIKDIVVCNVYWEDFKLMGLSIPRHLSTVSIPCYCAKIALIYIDKQIILISLQSS